MKKYVSLLIAVLIFASGILITGCSKSEEKKLIDCLTLTKSASSMELNLSTNAKMSGKEDNVKINMKVEDIQKDMKSVVDMEVFGKKQEFYMGISNGTAKVYMKDSSGKYSVKSVDSSQLNDIDIAKSFDSYKEFIEKNPSFISKKSNNTYELNVPKEKTAELYSKITGKSISQSLDSLKVEFVIGDDGYLQKVNLKTSSGSTDIEMDTEYLNYNKKFDIVFPNVSN